ISHLASNSLNTKGFDFAFIGQSRYRFISHSEPLLLGELTKNLHISSLVFFVSRVPKANAKVIA
ncbi:MAG: hypothetical protein L0K63_12670, partial [Yaniella sp.]|nr:hypothetical protein [Yaniella sp.]